MVNELKNTYKIVIDKETGQPANGKYITENSGKVTYQNGLLGEEFYETEFANIHKVYQCGKYNSVIIESKYLQFDGCESEEKFKVFKNEYGELFSKPILKIQTNFNKEANEKYISVYTTLRYSDDSELEFKQTNYYDMIKESGKYNRRTTTQLIARKTDNNTYSIETVEFNKKGNVIYSSAVESEDAWYTTIDIFDIDVCVFYDDGSLMLSIEKIDNNIYKCVYYNLLGQMLVEKVLTLNDAKVLNHIIKYKCYNNYEIDYKKVFECINEAEKKIIEETSNSLCRCTCSYSTK